MKPARNIGEVDVRHHRRIISKPIQAKPFAHIAVDGHPHA
jgi:hypothetical protein